MAVNAFIDNAKVMAKGQVTIPNHGMICEQNVDEIRRIFNKKFPLRLSSLDKFLSVALLTIELVPVPENEFTIEVQIRDTLGVKGGKR